MKSDDGVKNSKERRTPNNNSQGTTDMHNNIPLTKEHQLKFGARQGKLSAQNGYSKKQFAILNSDRLEDLYWLPHT